MPNIVLREVEQQLIIRLTGREERLATGNIVSQRAHITPKGRRRAHIDRGIESPGRELRPLGRVGRTMKDEVIHPRGQHLVDLGLALRKGGAEMLRQPRQCLGRGGTFTRKVGSRRGKFQDSRCAVVGFADRIVAQLWQVELRASERFTLGNIDRCVDINQVGRRSMRLVARDGSVSMCPRRPGLREVFE